MGILTKLYAYIYLRGFRIWSSYKTQMVLNVLSWVLPVFTYYFVGTSLGGDLENFTGVTNYTAFVVIGLAFQGYVSSTITTISQRLRNEQLYGTIEYYVLSEGGVLSFLVYSALWGFTINSVNAGVILGIGEMLHVHFEINPVSTLVVFALLLSSALGLSMISAGFTMLVKQGNPISFFFSTFTTLMSGTVFPVTVLPSWIKEISLAIPLTWALNGLRLTMLDGYGIGGVGEIVLVLVLFNAVLLPLGGWFYLYSFNRSRRKGTLSEY
ncbi:MULTISPECIES: ABC transporter permease [Metallosphaera]|uniref:ABC-2 type transporter n=3 Tax=Metallosphaera TaxID=41980 RepID=A4YF41_METS5|nr:MULTISPECIES: ABC transporter permease [Metallosphaera]ABP95043.1 ABC-2 type transporter [Metallosphaera sedula DSM 5348]AIM27029.1 ABC-2 type transporter [Metallosphaera sedula]AKV73947.1 ABC transporter [Metallosphaera sedula]AKV76186.1 ABC transporter [Metallosphaera sedula]AKV78438.1 ABC transporter [Metallosphaera sedula]